MSPHTHPDATETGHWLLSAPGLTLTARGGDRLPVHDGPGQFRRLAASAESALRASPAGAVIVGAVPFDESIPAHLVLTRLERHPHRPARRSDLVRSLQDPDLQLPSVAPHTADAPRSQPPPLPEPPPAAYLAAVRDILAEIDAGTVSKVVLARSLRIPLDGSYDHRHLVPALTAALGRKEPAGHLFSVSLPPPHPGATPPVLIGATPETLLRRTGDLLTLNPLAGTIARHPNPAVDRARAAALLRSGKDRAEHQHVIDALRHRLRPCCRTLDIPAEPRLHATSRLWHLSTPIRARLRHPAPSALALATALHPTPAVCGTPAPGAADLIRALEPIPRRYFSGLVGWMDQQGDGHWVIALRCGELDPSGLRVFAGAGIVTGSSPESELAETETKLATMLGAIEEARSGLPQPVATPGGHPS
ncbi:isochorismate synthase [Streptomyces sp. H27-S2]|uniref:isochorismate synthase n=1 Tax=Streptomyces antarcticus TaxID=2996458 RepID=UPI00227005DD|nr:isochorismate synthase [Streptomyces sp. H27-S2]MCY0950470.1 isochorismate synthase [Streptomyces sp. H27-S2]